MSDRDGVCKESTSVDEACSLLKFYDSDGAGSSREKVNASEMKNDFLEDRNNEIRNVITIPSSKVSRIVGIKGRETRYLAFESKAKIIVGDSSGDTTEVTLLGTCNAVAKAERMINECIKDWNFVYFDSHGNKIVDWKGIQNYSDKRKQKRIAELPTIRKDFYIEDPVISNMTISQVERWREINNNTEITGVFYNNNGHFFPNPIKTFEQAFQHYPEILQKVYDQGYKQPTPIQRQAWPILLSGGDMIGIAPSGTGNTLAYLLPALIHANGQLRENRDGPKVLIIVSSRARARVTYEKTLKYLPRGVKCLLVIGGEDRDEQIQEMNKGVDIVIATPGRLYDLTFDRHVHTITFSYIVLDDAAYLLRRNMNAISKLFFDLRPDHQTVLLSPTWPRYMLYFAEKYMTDPVHVSINSRNVVALITVTQKLMCVPDQEKYSILLDFVLNMENNDKVIIFCGSAQTVDYISNKFLKKEMEFYVIPEDPHGRDLAYFNMMNSTIKIIITTDLGAKGIIIKDVTHVIHYDFPQSMEDLIRRIGRIRKGVDPGTAISFITNQDAPCASQLIKILQEADIEVPEELLLMAESELVECENE